MSKTYNPIDIYDNCRRHMFRHYNKYGDLDSTINYILKGELYPLDERSLVGLEAELKVFDLKKDEWSLIPALDSGDHTDFSGMVDNEQVRLDVTTNVGFKKLQDYEKFQKEGKRYFIAYFNRKTEQVELIDINFPFCKCGGRLIKMIVLNDINTPPFYFGSTTQSLITVCTNNPYDHYKIEKDFGYTLISSTDIKDLVKDHYAIEIEDNEDDKSRAEAIKRCKIETDKEILKRFNNTANFFKTECNHPISVIGEEYYHLVGKDDEYYDTLVVWASDIIQQFFQTNEFLDTIYE